MLLFRRLHTALFTLRIGAMVRDGTLVYTGAISSLKRFKDDVKEVREGLECGIGVENFNDLKVGDRIEAFRIEEIKRTLQPAAGATA